MVNRVLYALPIVLLIAAALWRGTDGLTLNLGYVALVKAGMESGGYSAAAEEHLRRVSPSQPSAGWGLSLLARWRGDDAASRNLLLQFAGSASPRIRLLRAVLPDDVEFAQQVAQARPHDPLAVFWYAETVAATDPIAAIEAYHAGLVLNPQNGVRWVELGHLYYRAGNFEDALYAYDRGCVFRDRGANGCWRAGGLAEEMGLTDRAVGYYRRTLEQIPGWAPAEARLRALER